MLQGFFIDPRTVAKGGYSGIFAMTPDQKIDSHGYRMTTNKVKEEIAQILSPSVKA